MWSLIKSLLGFNKPLKSADACSTAKRIPPIKPIRSNNPEDYPQFYMKWNADSDGSGPYTFRYLLTNNWSAPPSFGRFENEKNWKPYSYFKSILNELSASDEQKNILESLNADVDMSVIGMVEAEKLIKTLKSERKAKREAEQAEKGKLPATKQALAKLDNIGIKYPEGISRAHAARLLKEHGERIEFGELSKQLSSIGIKISKNATLETLRELASDGAPTEEQMSKFNGLIDRLKALGVPYSIPKTLTSSKVEDMNDAIEEAIDAGDEAISEVKEGWLPTSGKYDYAVAGISPDANFNPFLADIVKRALKGTWNEGEHLKKTVAKHFPEAIIEPMR